MQSRIKHPYFICLRCGKQAANGRQQCGACKNIVTLCTACVASGMCPGCYKSQQVYGQVNGCNGCNNMGNNPVKTVDCPKCNCKVDLCTLCESEGYCPSCAIIAAGGRSHYSPRMSSPVVDRDTSHCDFCLEDKPNGSLQGTYGNRKICLECIERNTS